ncbi:MAG: hypothetical protein JXB36_16525 [Gammaproteobacteria bacterium]|nr:hypothetical protein [Gammaproteobacteria bacterium]
MRSPLQLSALFSMRNVLLPLAKLMLRCGLGCSEFIGLAKTAFVQAASEEYGVRGRPTNISRVAAMTGLSRKEVKKIRDAGDVSRWTPDMELTPTNTVIHFWHFDPLFSDAPGVPRRLAYEGVAGFSALVRKYAGDIPPGAMRKELLRARTITEDDDGCLRVEARYFCPDEFGQDFVRNAAFAMRHLGNTLLYNAALAARAQRGEEDLPARRFERFAWTDRLPLDAIDSFKQWAREEGAVFIEHADSWIGSRESALEITSIDKPKTVGIGVYYFEDEE